MKQFKGNPFEVELEDDGSNDVDSIEFGNFHAEDDDDDDDDEESDLNHPDPEYDTTEEDPLPEDIRSRLLFGDEALSENDEFTHPYEDYIIGTDDDDDDDDVDIGDISIDNVHDMDIDNIEDYELDDNNSFEVHEYWETDDELPDDNNSFEVHEYWETDDELPDDKIKNTNEPNQTEVEQQTLSQDPSVDN